jgi:hypothetical protein
MPSHCAINAALAAQQSALRLPSDSRQKALRRRGPPLDGEKASNGDTHMNKMMRSFRSDYVEDALLITAVIIIAFGLYLAAAYLLVVI